MKKIILCEGKIDAILISLFLEKFGWTYFDTSQKQNPPITLPSNPKNEELNWYRHPGKPDQELAIWGVGGYDNVKPKLKVITDLIQLERQPKKTFNKIILLVDNDTGNSDKHLSDIDNWLEISGISLLDKIQLQEWLKAEIKLFGNEEKHPIQLLSIVLPPDSKGNLEIFLLNELKENSDDEKILVEKAKFFIDNIEDKPYLIQQRLRGKAWLGSVLSVMFPDWSLKDRNIRLKKVNWENLESVFSAYQKLRDL